MRYVPIPVAIAQQIADAPNPMEDPEGYLLWCELHPCTACAGVGEEDDPPWICGVCQGSGIREDGRDD